VAARSLLPRRDACAYLNISPRTLDRRRKAGLIPDRRLGERTVRFEQAALDAFKKAGYPRGADRQAVT
jgi:excisionase family DNA binding protein